MKRIAVFGAAGVMARGIIEVLLTHTNCEVAAFDVVFTDSQKLKDARDALKLALYHAGEREKKLIYEGSPQKVAEAFARAVWLAPENKNLAAYLPNCDAVIEAVVEIESVKKELFAQIAKYADKTTPIFTNTSTIQIKRLAEGFGYGKGFMGLHFFNPVPVMKPIEGILYENTAVNTLFIAEHLAHKMCKKLLFAPDTPGFVVNGIYIPAMKVALEEMEAGASFEEIDKACTTGKWVNFPPARRFVLALIGEAEKMVLKYKTDPRVRHFSEEKAKETIEELMKLGTNMPAGPFELKELLASGRAEEILKDPKGEEKYKLRLAMGPAQFMDLVGIDVALDCVKSIAAQEPERCWREPKILVEMKSAGKLGRKSGEGFYKYGSRVDIEYPDGSNGEYAKITFGDGKRNTLSIDIVKKLRDAFRELKNKPNLKAVFLQSKGRNFSTGADINSFPLCLMDAEALRISISEGKNLMEDIANAPSPVIAVVEGYALGGGYELTLACDYIVAQAKAEVGLPEVGLGILPGWGGTQRLPRRAGLWKALDMIINAKIVKAESPWVDAVIKKEEMVWENLKKIAESVNKREFKHLSYSLFESCHLRLMQFKMHFAMGQLPESAFLAFATVRDGNQGDLVFGLAREWDAIFAAFKTKDAQEGIKHFLETGKHKFKKAD